MSTPSPHPDRSKQATPTIIAHRGAWTQPADQNSLSAIQRAIALGADGIEVDLRATSDGHIVLHHDPTLDGHPVAETPLGELEAHAQAQGVALATLDQALGAIPPDVLVNLEVKQPGFEHALVEALEDHDRGPHLLVTSFHDAVLTTLAEADARVETGLILGLENPSPYLATRWSERFPAQRARAARVQALAPHDNLVRAGVLRQAQRLGLDAYVWTVNDPKRLSTLVRDARVTGIITDDVELALDVTDDIGLEG